MIQEPLTVIKKCSNAGGWKHFIEAKFDDKPTTDDMFAASKSIGYGCILLRQGGYILSQFKVQQIESDNEENGLWKANWFAILD